MNRLDRYYIPPGVPARPPAPPLPRKGILLMPPPHPPPSSSSSSRQPRHLPPQPQSQFHAAAAGPQSLPMQPEPPGSRRPLPPRLLDYGLPSLPPRPLDSQNVASAMSLHGAAGPVDPHSSSPRMALQRILDLGCNSIHLAML